MAQSDPTAQAALEALVDRFHSRGRLRVWSLVITAFGDAIVPRGGRVALGLLRDLMARLRVEPGALRTAMSRLTAEGWVIREKEGRNSFYRLAPEGRHAFDLATRRIYSAGPPCWNGNWTVIIAPPGAPEPLRDAAALGFVRINGSVYLRPQTDAAAPVPDDLSGMLVVHGNSAEHPEAMLALWPAQETGAAYRALSAALQPLDRALSGGKRLSGIDAMAARTLVVHDWRRIVLRDPGLPEGLLPADWPGEETRALVARLYDALAEPSEAWLDAMHVPPPADRGTIGRRYADRLALQSSR